MVQVFMDRQKQKKKRTNRVEKERKDTKNNHTSRMHTDATMSIWLQHFSEILTCVVLFWLFTKV